MGWVYGSDDELYIFSRLQKCFPLPPYHSTAVLSWLPYFELVTIL